MGGIGMPHEFTALSITGGFGGSAKSASERLPGRAWRTWWQAMRTTRCGGTSGIRAEGLWKIKTF